MLDCPGRAVGAAGQEDTGLSQVVHDEPLDDPALGGGEHRRSALALPKAAEVGRAQSLEQVEQVAAGGQDAAQSAAVGQGASGQRGAQFGLLVTEIRRPATFRDLAEPGHAGSTNSRLEIRGTRPAVAPSSRNRSIARRPLSP